MPPNIQNPGNGFPGSPGFALSFPAVAQHVPVAPDTTMVKGIVGAAGKSPSRRVNFNEPTLIIAMFPVVRWRVYNEAVPRPLVDDFDVTLNHNGTDYLTTERGDETNSGTSSTQKVNLGALSSDARLQFIMLASSSPQLNVEFHWGYEAPPPREAIVSVNIFSMSREDWLSRGSQVGVAAVLGDTMRALLAEGRR